MEVKEDNAQSSDDSHSPSQEHTKQREPQHCRSSRRRDSKIVAPSQRRVKSERTFTLPVGEKSPSPSETGMFERSMLHPAAKEQKMKRAEKEFMKACTFTPGSNSSRSSRGSSAIFDRLLSESSPRKAIGRRHGSQKKSPTNSCGSTPSRIAQLYHDGVRREQSRARTNKVDDEDRRRRTEEKELEHCTFRPNMDWSKKKPPRVNEQQSSTASKDSAYNHSLRTPRSRNIPPVDVITTRVFNARREADSFVSPLRHLEITDLTSIGTDSVGDDTEYGSI